MTEAQAAFGASVLRLCFPQTAYEQGFLLGLAYAVPARSLINVGAAFAASDAALSAANVATQPRRVATKTGGHALAAIVAQFEVERRRRPSFVSWSATARGTALVLQALTDAVVGVLDADGARRRGRDWGKWSNDGLRHRPAACRWPVPDFGPWGSRVPGGGPRRNGYRTI